MAGGRLALNVVDHLANKAHNRTRKDHDQRGGAGEGGSLRDGRGSGIYIPARVIGGTQ